MDFKNIESKWQAEWEKKKIFNADVSKKPKFFITLPYPYVNGAMHIGHAFSAFRCDSYARFKRMQGFNVLYPQGFHATGEPILGAIERLRQKDKAQIETFKLFGASDKDLEDFIKNGPEFVARYWMERWIEDLKKAGFSIDWRRTFITAITPQYNRFIEWQYNTLRKKGYVVKGTHPVVWCPHDQSPTGDHDRQVGEGESPIEYTIIKFPSENGEKFPCGTLRPETVFGAINLWVHPEANYVKARVNGEVWYLSENVVKKFEDQMRKIEILEKFSGEKLVGKFVINPVTDTKIPVLPAFFVDPKTATGIVMSVPSHAPFDWIALEDLQKHPENYEKYGIAAAVVDALTPISLFKLEGFSEHPAKDMVEKLKIKTQADVDKLQKATEELYKKEYHLGILKNVFGKYAGKKISEVKQKLIKDFQKAGIVEKVWELTGPVICRCTTECHVKILKGQWFLKFSDKKWKARVKKMISSMKFYPELVKQDFLKTLEWLEDKACTRKSGLGTKLPWDKEWIVETLSDSTIYMAFYTITRILNEEKIPAEKLTDAVFDFVFLGKGTAKKVSKQSGLSEKILKTMRQEFEYFYPVDLRNSAKELVPNHLTFYLFHHAAIWDKPKYWPKAIGVNGMVMVWGKKMSKRFGNILPLKNLIEKYGSDLVRVNIISAAEDLDDPDWRDENISAFQARLNFLEELITKLPSVKRAKILNIDKFLRSRIQKSIEKTVESYEKLKFRTAAQTVFFEALNDLKWYIERSGGIENCNQKVLKKSLDEIVRLLAPLVPHVAEEFWRGLGEKSFVATAKMPSANKKEIDKEAELAESYLQTLLEDIKHVEKILKKKANRVHIIVAAKQKFESFAKGKEEFLKREYQLKILNEAKAFLEKKLKKEVFIDTEEASNLERAKKADVLKPAIYLE
jgi:leucyl-tRNA synthetase